MRILGFLAFTFFTVPAFAAPPVHMATGIKICEVTADSAIVWTDPVVGGEAVGRQGGALGDRSHAVQFPPIVPFFPTNKAFKTGVNHVA